MWKLTETLSNPKNPEWDGLIKSALGENIHSDRIKGFLLSREALLECLKENSHHLTPIQLELSGFSALKQLPQYTLSLSHTKTHGAALIADRQSFRSVGIDIEHEERPVKDSIAQRVSHPHDTKLRNIELWCLKEAVFKTLMNTGNFEKPVEFSSIELGDRTWSHSPSGLKGEWELHYVKPVVIALAFLKS